MELTPESMVDVGEALRHARHDGAIWSLNCEQLNVNLMRLSTGAGIPEHSNGELDVLIAVYEGEGELTVEGAAHALGPGVAVVVPRGARRGLRCLRGPLVYLTAHRQRGGLMPT
ncbi:MAG TPA: cupin domain-containing protein [Chloroflexaceae bacterium]|nr:cupin domain-containing protein [Chloroflexaceae bacterium]